MKIRVVALTLAGLAVAAACKTPAPATTGSRLRDGEPVAVQPTADPEAVAVAEARKMLMITGKDIGLDGAKNLCAGACHGVDIEKVKAWATKSVELETCWLKATTEAAGDSKKEAISKIACMKASPTATTYAVGKLGFMRAGVQQPVFEQLFKTALGETAYAAEYKKFVKKTIMPPDDGESPQVSAEDFEVLRKWSVKAVETQFKGLEGAFNNNIIIESGTCTETISSKMKEHVELMAVEGWRAKHKALGTTMFGCDRQRCFEGVDADGRAVFPLAESTTFGKGWTPTNTKFKIRHLRTLSSESSYWMRSSADGRFVGNGGAAGEGDEGGSTIEDLLLKNRPRISVDGQFDPGFFPDNKGWTFHDGPGGAAFCSQRLLEDQSIKTVRPKEDTRWCTVSRLNVYQHVGASLDGSGYYVLRSDNYVNDNGGYDLRSDPSVVSFSTPFSSVEIWPMSAAGDSFKVEAKPYKTSVPFEGDWSIAPSNLISASRIASGTKQVGYRLRKFEGEAPNLELTALATVCMPGGKMSFSYDERFVMTHHYVAAEDWQELGYASEDDAEFKELVGNAANIYVYDLLKKARTRLTNVKAGQYALFPHARADNWIYFLVRDTKASKEYVMATDAALELGQTGN